MYEYKATLIRVVDGDTIEVDVSLGFYVTVRTTLRLEGINTPELHAKDPAARTAAKAARDYLIGRLPPEFIIRTFKDKTEKFGRMLARVYVDTALVNRELLDKGFAVAFMPESD